VAELSHETRAGIVATGSAGSREVAGSTQGSTTGRTAEGTGGNTAGGTTGATAGGTTGATAGGTTGATAGNTRVVRVVGGRVVGGAGRVSLAEGAPDASFRFVAERHAPGERPDGARTGDAAPSPQWSLDGTDGTVVDEHQIVVLRGDTLWSIAAAHLGPAAGAAVIDAEWRRWFALNREVIGKNADQILPGQLLTPPVSIQKASRTQAPGSEPSFAVGAGS
jgi:nucleoid-associated protein YgaU